MSGEPCISSKHVKKLSPTKQATSDILNLKHNVQSIIRISKKPKKSFEQALIQQQQNLFESQARESKLNSDLITVKSIKEKGHKKNKKTLKLLQRSSFSTKE